ncbi:hypothetical protein [Sinobaca sp. H24]|uniref:hypothetical protein n=1 Tax=Sinobaca sp. H24 TaxID=2923376 RepID=UPI00207A7854|nr:hypothetical protein [Sinobaca sp. H24]
MLSIYFYTIVISFIAAGVVFFIKNAAKMNGKYRLLTLTIGIISLGLFSAGFITPGLGLPVYS